MLSTSSSIGHQQLNSGNREKRAQNWFIFLGLSPVLLLFLVLRIIPIGRTILMSFYDWSFIGIPARFVGFSNYISLLSDRRFLTAIRNTSLFAVGSVLLR